MPKKIELKDLGKTENKDNQLELLPYDSDFFGLKIGKYALTPDGISNFETIKHLIKKSDYDLVYFFCDVSLSEKISINEFDCQFVDTQLNLKMEIPQDIVKLDFTIVTNNNLSSFTSLEELYMLSDEVAMVSRFSYDKNIELKKVKDLYRRIIDNSLSKKFGEGIILEIDTANRVTGLFVVGSSSIYPDCNIGKEILIAVKKEPRVKGIGKKLFCKFLNYCKNNGIKEIFTKVSIKNLNSINFHMSLGYKVFKIENVYHVWLKNKQ